MDKDPNLCLVVVYADQARLYSENVIPPSKHSKYSGDQFDRISPSNGLKCH